MRRIAFIPLIGSCLLAAPAAAQFNAGGFAIQQHQHDLMRQQSAPNNEPRRAESAPTDMDESLRQEMEAEILAIQEQHRLQMEPEYHRRAQRDGQQSADAWAAQEAQRLGAEAARYLQEKYGLD